MDGDKILVDPSRDGDKKFVDPSSMQKLNDPSSMQKLNDPSSVQKYAQNSYTNIRYQSRLYEGKKIIDRLVRRSLNRDSNENNSDGNTLWNNIYKRHRHDVKSENMKSSDSVRTDNDYYLLRHLRRMERKYNSSNSSNDDFSIKVIYRHLHKDYTNSHQPDIEIRKLDDVGKSITLNELYFETNRTYHDTDISSKSLWNISPKNLINSLNIQPTKDFSFNIRWQRKTSPSSSKFSIIPPEKIKTWTSTENGNIYSEILEVKNVTRADLLRPFTCRATNSNLISNLQRTVVLDMIRELLVTIITM